MSMEPSLRCGDRKYPKATEGERSSPCVDTLSGISSSSSAIAKELSSWSPSFTRIRAVVERSLRSLEDDGELVSECREL